ncbi:MAG: NAD(P)H-hydrate dehydratase [Kiritimatiellia bacterium]|nr:NAD(P)H-hydrate dehydratase [Kiritimatiellia bacterium]
MKWITPSDIRKAELEAIEQRAIDPYRLMCRAGAAVAAAAESLAQTIGTRNIVLVAGSGNNGGDAFVAARCLHEDGFRPTVLVTTLPALLKDVAKRAWADMAALGVPCHPLTSRESWSTDYWFDASVYPRHAVLVDAILGTGTNGAARGVPAVAIEWINRHDRHCPVLSVDIPSGLDAGSGNALGAVVRADVTLTFTRPKTGFSNPSARLYLGHLDVVDIGIPDDLIEPYERGLDTELLTWPELRKMRSPRPIEAHKGDFGHALIVGGSARYPNAPVMSACAALRAGAGRVTLAAPQESLQALSLHAPEVIFRAIASPSDLKDADLSAYSAIAVGPGLGSGAETERLLDWLINQNASRLVLDADALTSLAHLRASGWKQIASESSRLVITPHPGEAARLLQTDIPTIQGDRIAAVQRLAEEYQAIAVLKGSGTLVCAPGEKPWSAMVGNPGMATAGSGDVLTGLVAGLLAKRYGCLNAASLGVWLHGAIGDKVAFRHGEEALTAMMLVHEIRL